MIASLCAIVPFFVFAQTASCPSLTKNLSYASRGAEVIKLQQFLISQKLLPAGSATGFFGKGTQSAVQSYQRAHNIVSSGIPTTTGYGAVGKKTRAAIGKCLNAVSRNTPTYSQSSYVPNYAQGSYGSSYSQTSYAPPYSQSNYYSQSSYVATSTPRFIPEASGVPFGQYFQYNMRRGVTFGTTDAAVGQAAFGPSNGLHSNGFLRYSANVGDWGTAYTEVAEFVPGTEFLYLTGWYPGGADSKYRPTDFGNDMKKHFASIHTTKAAITTPGGTFDILPQLEASLGEPYALLSVPSYSYSIQFEGDLTNNDTGEVIYHFSHATKWDPPQSSNNPLFDQALGSQTRLAIKQTETWHDPVAGDSVQSSLYGDGVGSYWTVFNSNGTSLYYMKETWIY